VPYLVGGLAPGVVVSVIAYIVFRPLIAVYQVNRIKRLKKRYEKRRLAGIAKAGSPAKSD